MDVTSVIIEANVEEYVVPNCTVYHNADSLSCIVGGDVVNDGLPGTYVVTFNAIDLSGNLATPVNLPVIVINYSGPEYCDYDNLSNLSEELEINCLNYRNGFEFDDYTFHDIASEANGIVTVATSDMIEIDDFCQSLGDDYEKIGENKYGLYVQNLDFEFIGVRNDFYSEDGEHFYDYHFRLFGSYYEIYEVYDECQELKRFSSNQIVESDFEGMVMWIQESAASGPLCPSLPIYCESNTLKIYMTPEILNDFEYLISVYGATSSLEYIENLLSSDFGTYYSTVIIGLAGIAISGGVSGALALSADVAIALGISVLASLEGGATLLWSNYVDSFEGDDFSLVLEQAKNSQGNFISGIVIETKFIATSGAAGSTFDIINTPQLWNKSDGINRMEDDDFGKIISYSSTDLT